MKFMLFMLPAVPGTREERRRLRPISANTERFQQMLAQVTELSRIAEDLGFDMVAFPEHFLQTEGLEMGGTPSLHAHIAARTNHIKVGPLGFVLPGWNPLRLACEVGWLDQITQGRTFIGLARGYQTRWLNSMAQQLKISATMSDQSAIDLANREAFDEVLKILKLAWGDEPFSFKGKYYEFPYPYETGTPWMPVKWTQEYGAPGELKNGMIRKIMVVPKPYQKPHPPLFQAFSVSESTIISCARNGIAPMTLVPWLPNMKRLAEVYRSEAAKAGYHLELGERMGVTKYVYIGRDKQEAYKRAELGSPGTFFLRLLQPVRLLRSIADAGGRRKVSQRQGDAAAERVDHRAHGPLRLSVRRNGGRGAPADGRNGRCGASRILHRKHRPGAAPAT